MQFKIEQIAICPTDPAAAIELLSDMGLAEWSHDHVCAHGFVFGASSSNEANLSFNYEAAGVDKPLEFEVLHYTQGANWMANKERRNSASHLGMHCTNDELEQWREFFEARHISVAQEVFTDSHTNPVIAGKRRYNYVIFNTRQILGIDLKFIVRWNAA